MTDTSVAPPPPSLVGVLKQQSPSVINAFRVKAVADRLTMYFNAEAASGASQLHNNPSHYLNLLLSLARGIDFSISNNQIPPKAEELPKLIKEILHRKNDACSQGVIMVLLISVKSACKAGWFSEKDAEELISFACEMERWFCSPVDINSATSEALSAVSTILARFYPRIRMGQILASLEAQPGYGAFLVDFPIPNSASPSPREGIMLLAARIDNIETSACIITPQQVNILLNGEGVDRRTNIFVDPGPQMPTVVTAKVKYGTNLLQAVGQFNGHYVIAVAFMTMNPIPDSTAVKDYVPPVVSSPDSDPDIIEGQSRISLNCPISHTRIQVPVKGHSCRHLQCFDYSNFVGINSRRPSWRCPHCNSYVCFTDLRIDQNIAKVLKEVSSNVTDVMISADGSWKAVMESDSEVAQFRTLVPEGQSVGSPHAIPDIMDLTGDNDEMDATLTCENEDIKPLQQCVVNQQVTSISLPSQTNNTGTVGREGAPLEDDFWAGIFLAPPTSSARLDTQIANGVMEAMLANATSPVFTDAISPAVNNLLGDTNAVESLMQSQLSALNQLPMQQMQPINPIVSNEYGTAQSIPQNVRTSVTVQARTAHLEMPSPAQRSMIPCSSSISPATLPQAPSAVGINHVRNDLDRHHQLPRPRVPSPQVSNRPPSSLQCRAEKQGHTPPTQPVHPIQNTGPHRAAYGRFTGFNNAHLQQALNHVIMPSQSPNATKAPSTRAQTSMSPSPGTRGTPILRSQPAVPQVAQGMGQTPKVGNSVPPGFKPAMPASSEQRGNVGAQPSPRGDGSANLPSGENWRPTGRMRGSITGRTIGEDISHLMIQPTRPTRPSGGLSRAPPNPVSNLSAPPHLQNSMTSSKNPLPNPLSGNTQGTQ